MIIRTISAAKRRRLSRRVRVEIGATADVPEGEDPDRAMSRLRAWVDEQIDHERQILLHARGEK